MHVPVLQEIYLYTLQRMQCQEFFSLSRKEIHVANKCMRHALNMHQDGLAVSTHQGRGKRCEGNIPAKAAGHFSQDLS